MHPQKRKSAILSTMRQSNKEGGWQMLQRGDPWVKMRAAKDIMSLDVSLCLLATMLRRCRMVTELAKQA